MLACGVGYRFAEAQEINPSDVGPGTELIIPYGTYVTDWVISFQGTRSDPVLIRGEAPEFLPQDGSAGAVPLIRGRIIFKNAKWVELQDLSVSASGLDAVLITEGSEGITLRNMSIYDSMRGIRISNAAGPSHRFEGNTISGNERQGIFADRVNLAGPEKTKILENSVVENGGSGIEIFGSNFHIEGNSVFNNGKVRAKAAGIKISAGEGAEPVRGMGTNNTIRENTISGSSQIGGDGGEGIRLDRWSDENAVSNNIIYKNYGPGIHLHDAAGNVLQNNTLWNNAQSRQASGMPWGDIMFSAAREGKDTNRAEDNILRNNIFLIEKDNRDTGYEPYAYDRKSKRNSQTSADNKLLVCREVISGVNTHEPGCIRQYKEESF